MNTKNIYELLEAEIMNSDLTEDEKNRQLSIFRDTVEEFADGGATIGGMALGIPGMLIGGLVGGAAGVVTGFFKGLFDL